MKNRTFDDAEKVIVNDLDFEKFILTIEVVPPGGDDPEALLTSLEALGDLPVDGFSVATNPVAKPRMCAMALCALIQQRTGRPAVFHCTTRDHNRISLQSLMWGAKALGVSSVLVATGDFVAMADRKIVSDVKDVNVFELVTMARESGLHTGAVLDFRPEVNGLEREVKRLEKKVAAGAQYAVTQPIYDRDTAKEISQAVAHLNIPVIMGILPLRTPRHADFLHERVAGIAVPEALRKKMHSASDSVAQGVSNARDMVAVAREFFQGACVMPPFDHYEILPDVLGRDL
ncbi:homocysteine S-methyltransferase [Desulfocicer vacuolatum DSM 3385]|uniref:Methylenetetrahydrofolate reductase n=1 Tax=Desulfocicer vacuolatum DSM 3385 TaxID=1121400 RepID=A0A1W1YPN4_9BACT|nr:methylenetetrahydrofolate reductase [Desulfocicer vacuolatum]SMC38072.1 homocysteine S-methyltransferase [Desulfocicer vacuolatum DSM 3385]